MSFTEEQLKAIYEKVNDFYHNKNDSVLTEIFQLIDKNSNNLIDAQELKSFVTLISGENVSDSEISEMIREADTNKNGEIELSEFIETMIRHRS